MGDLILKAGYLSLTIISGIILLLGVLLLIYYLYILWLIYHYPKDNPFNYVKDLKREVNPIKKKRIVFIGNSLTHGNISVNYIKMIKEKLGNSFDYINAGMNAELAYNILLRLDSIIACKPDFVTILIGTNDASRELSPYQDKRSMKKLNLPQNPNKSWFIENMRKIIKKLIEETDAKIALCSIPIISEDPSSEIFKQSIEYSKTIKEIAKNKEITYLPFNEKMIDYLQKNPSNPKYSYEKRLVEIAAVKHFLLRKSFDEISEEYGFSLLVDHIHINSEGAKIITNLIIDFISS